MLRLNKKFGWSSTSKHPFNIELNTPLWPPFYSTYLFLPKIGIKIKNDGSLLNRVSLSVDVRKYDGDISSVTTINDGWGDTGQVRRIDDWKPGEKKSFTVTIPGNRLPTAGTYILRVIVTRWIPLGTPYEGIINELKKANIDKDTQKKVLKFTTEHWEEIGIDPHKMQIGGFKGELIFDGRVVDYCRVEEFSNLLNYWLVLATLLLVFATTLLALVPLISTPHSGSETGPAQHRLAYEKQH